jgi:hypothetical protein
MKTPNETVAKPEAEAIAHQPSRACCGPPPTSWPPTSAPGLCGAGRSPAPHGPPLCQPSLGLQLLEVRPQAGQRPWRLPCALPPAGAALAALGVADAPKPRRQRPEATTVVIPTDGSGDLALHLVEVLLRLVRDSPHDNGPLAHVGALRIAQPWRALPPRRPPVCLSRAGAAVPPKRDGVCRGGGVQEWSALAQAGGGASGHASLGAQGLRLRFAALAGLGSALS